MGYADVIRPTLREIISIESRLTLHNPSNRLGYRMLQWNERTQQKFTSIYVLQNEIKHILKHLKSLI